MNQRTLATVIAVAFVVVLNGLAYAYDHYIWVWQMVDRLSPNGCLFLAQSALAGIAVFCFVMAWPGKRK